MSDKYAEALEELDRLKAAGMVSQAQYDLHRSKLLAEASQPRRPFGFRVALFVVAVLLGWLLVRILASFIY